MRISKKDVDETSSRSPLTYDAIRLVEAPSYWCWYECVWLRLCALSDGFCVGEFFCLSLWMIVFVFLVIPTLLTLGWCVDETELTDG